MFVWTFPKYHVCKICGKKLRHKDVKKHREETGHNHFEAI